MVRVIILFFFLFHFSCTSSEQVIKKNNENIDNLFFNAVSKNIKFNSFEKNQINLIGEKLIFDWYNKNIKTNGIEGSLNILITNLETTVDKKDDYFKVVANISMQFNLESNTLASKKSLNLSASEFSEISGRFSILDQENLIANTIKATLKKISDELKNLN